jgi:hypothetical protein
MSTRAAAAAVLAAAVLAAPAAADRPEFRWYSGKPAGVLELPTDCRYRTLPGLAEPASSIRGETELRELYLRLHLPRAAGPRTVDARFVRASGDATANQSRTYGPARASRPYPVLHFELGDGAGGVWQARVCGPGPAVRVATRYAKQHTLD